MPRRIGGNNMSKITYTDKVALNENASVNDINKIKAADMNEIKSVVNANDDNVGTLSNLNTTDKSNIVSAINEVNSKEVVLYNSTSGSTSASLSDSTANYTYIEIIFKENVNNKIYSTGKILNPNGKNTTLFYAEFPSSASGNIYLFGTQYTISGTSISVDSNRYGFSTVNGSGAVNYENRIRILRVIGYK